MNTLKNIAIFNEIFGQEIKSIKIYLYKEVLTMKKRDKYLLISLIILTCIVRFLLVVYDFGLPIPADLPKEIGILGNCTVAIFFLGIIIAIGFFITKIIFNVVKKNNKNTFKNIFLYLLISRFGYVNYTSRGISNSSYFNSIPSNL